MQQLLALPDIPPQTVVSCISRMIDAEEYQQAQSLITQWGALLINAPEFQAAWALLIVSQRDAAGAKKTV